MGTRALPLVAVALSAVSFGAAGADAARSAWPHRARVYRLANYAPDTQIITVVNRASLPERAVRRLERALVIQARQLARWWHTPPVAFGPGGWPLVLQRGDPAPGVFGYHIGDSSQSPESFVGVDGWTVTTTSVPAQTFPAWEASASHELLEMLANPIDLGYEVCDPVADQTYAIGGVGVSDFALPAWFDAKAAGPRDFMHAAAFRRSERNRLHVKPTVVRRHGRAA